MSQLNVLLKKEQESHAITGKKVKVKADIALPGKPISELWDVTCHMGSHSVICPRHKWMRPPNPSHAGCSRAAYWHESH